jgi:hypothetical protein
MTKALAQRACEWCAAPFEPIRGNQLFCAHDCCARACMSRFLRGENMTRDYTCIECGTVFSAVRRDAKFCGRRCCQRWHDRRRQPRNRLVAEPVPASPATTPAAGADPAAGWPRE